MRPRQSPYEIVGDSSDEGGHRYQPLDRFILREILVTVPGVQEELRKNGVEMEKNRDKSSNCDVCVTCDDVRCFL